MDINFFIQYVMKEEGSDRYLRQTPVHVDMQRHIDESDMSLIWGAVKVGKCVTHRTMLTLEDGHRISAKELKRRFDAGEKLRVWTFDRATWRRQAVDVVSVFDNGVRDLVQVTAASGHVCTTTPNHPYLTDTPDGLDFVEAAELTTRDMVCVADVALPAERGDASAFTVFALYSLHAGQSSAKVRPMSPSGDRLTWNITTARHRDLYEFFCELAAQGLTQVDRVARGEWVTPTRDGTMVTLSSVRDTVEGWGFELEEKPTKGLARLKPGRAAATAIGRRSALDAIAGLIAPWLADHPYTPVGQVRMPAKVAALVEEMAAAAGVTCRRVRASWLRRRLKHGVTLHCGAAYDQVYFEQYNFSQVLQYLAEHHDQYRDWLQQFHDDMTGYTDLPGIVDAKGYTRKVEIGHLTKRVVAKGQVQLPTLLRAAWVPKSTTSGLSMQRVMSVRRLAMKRPTIGVEVSGDHTHITDGIVTHNTQQVTVARTLFHLGKNQNIRVLIVQSTGELAKDALHQIKQMIENSERLHQVFPALRPGDRWAEKEIRVQRTAISLTPSVRAIGANTKIDGSRYDLIIIDDALSFDNTYTKTERDKLFKWLQTVPLSRAALGAKIVTIGNAFHCMLPDQLVRTDYGFVKAHLLTPGVMKIQVSRKKWETLQPHNYHLRRVENEKAVRIHYVGVPWTTEVTANHKLMDENGEEVYAGHVEAGDMLSMWRSTDPQLHSLFDELSQSKDTIIPDHVAFGIQLDYAEHMVPLNVVKVAGGSRFVVSKKRQVEVDGGRLLYQVKEVEHFTYTGNVYDVTTSTGWFATAPIVIHNSDDPMHRFEKMPGWKAKRYPARDPVTKKSLMPYLWPQSALDAWEKSRSPAEVRRSLDCTPWSNETARFKLEWMEAALKRGKNIHIEDGEPVFFRTYYNLEEEQAAAEKQRKMGAQVPVPVGVFTGVDFGYGLSEEADFTAMYTHAVFDDGSTVLLHMEKGRFTTSEYIDKVVEKHHNYGADIFVESVLAQKFMFNVLKDSYPNVPIFEWRTQGTGTVGNKWHAIYGIAMVEDDYARGRPILPCIAIQGVQGVEYEVHPLIREYIDACLTYVPDKTVHTDDMLMASWIALAGARERGSPEYLAAVLGPDIPYHPSFLKEDGTEMDPDERMGARFWHDINLPIPDAPWGLDEEIE